MLTPPMSSDVHVFSGGFIAVGREASTKGPGVDGRCKTAVPLPLTGEESGEPSIALPLSCSVVGGGLMRLGLVIGMADLATVREAIALARALW